MTRCKNATRPNLVQLESRETPYTVTNTDWITGAGATHGSLPWAVQSANAIPGKDVIIFDFTALGNNPVFNSKGTLVVTDSIDLIGETNLSSGKSVKIQGDSPLFFDKQAGNGQGTEEDPPTPPPPNSSTVQGIKFDQCNGTAVKVGSHIVAFSVCQFSNNFGYIGGAIQIGSAGEVTVQGGGNLFMDNKAGFGGAIHNAGKLTVEGGTFSFNAVSPMVAPPPIFILPGGQGGAIYSSGVLIAGNQSGGPVFYNNYAATDGGGVYIDSESTTASSFTGGTFESNHTKFVEAEGGWTGTGGGIRIAKGSLNISGTFFNANSSGSGGGLSVSSIATVGITTAKFEWNTTNDSGGVYRGRAIDIESGGTVTISGTSFAYNGIRGTWTDGGSNTFLSSPPE
jgi:hypothetical protein